MDRESIEQLLSAHVHAIERAVEISEHDAARKLYREHLNTARRQLARCQGGESERNLRAAAAQQLIAYRTTALPGTEAEAIGRSFGELCRALGVKSASADHREVGFFGS